MKILKYIIILTIVFLFAVSCDNKTQTNNNYIPQDTMAMVISEIHIADATLNVIMNTEKFKNVDGYYASVLKKYNISRSRFDTSLAYYTSKPEVFNRIYEDVMYIISQRKGEIIALPDDKKVNVNNQNFRKIAFEKSNFDDKKSKNILLDKKSDLNSFSGKFSLHFNSTDKISNKLQFEIYDIIELKFNINMLINLTDKRLNKYPIFIVEIYEKNKKIMTENIDVSKFITRHADWNSIDINTNLRLPQNIKQGKIVIYLSNVFNQDFFIDDIKIDISGK